VPADELGSLQPSAHCLTTGLVMQGTVVTAGRARAVVVGTGQNTAIGQIR